MNARIEPPNFVWTCSCGRTTQSHLMVMAKSVKEEETTILLCSRPNCDVVFDLSEEFEENLEAALATAEEQVEPMEEE